MTTLRSMIREPLSGEAENALPAVSRQFRLHPQRRQKWRRGGSIGSGAGGGHLSVVHDDDSVGVDVEEQISLVVEERLFAFGLHTGDRIDRPHSDAESRLGPGQDVVFESLDRALIGDLHTRWQVECDHDVIALPEPSLRLVGSRRRAHPWDR